MHPKPPTETARQSTEKSCNRNSKEIDIISYNIEGVKSNAASLIQLSRGDNIIALQETWLWTYEEDIIENIVPNYIAFVRCDDINDNLTAYQAPRGKAGVALLWPKERSKHIRKLEEGNERIIAIEVNTSDSPLCIINTYMPTFGSSSSEYYAEHLDILHNIIDNYLATHKIIVCGDFNGSLVGTRTNSQDKLLKQFVQEHDLKVGPMVKEKCTFYGYGGSSSQIDYILSPDEYLVYQTEVMDRSAIDLSTHVQIKTTIVICTENDNNTGRTQPTSIRKYHWDRADQDSYKTSILERVTPAINKYSPEQTVQALTKILLKASRKAVPNRIVKLKGHSFKLSPTTRELMSQSKYYHYLWKTAGRPDPEHPLSLQRKEAKYSLRQQQRREFAISRNDLFNEIMQRPTDKLFHKLIRRNRNCKQAQAPTLYVDNTDVDDATMQRRAFAEYYEDLAVPKEHVNFDQDLFVLNEIQNETLTTVHGENNEIIEPFTEQEITQCIRTLNYSVLY